jgi:sphingosine kinase
MTILVRTVQTQTQTHSSITQLVRAIRKLSRPSSLLEKRERFLVVVNPRSGPKRNGEQVYETVLKPMLEQAGINHDVIVTTHSRHAEELIQEQRADDRDISNYDGIVALGGDGIVHEIMQGIKNRTDSKELLDKLKLGIVPCGSANGLAKSLAHASKERCSPLDSAFLICKGYSSKMDIAK